LLGLYQRLVDCYGQQPWWPAETPFEVIVGAVLTQNAAWTNVEKAIERLRAGKLLTLPALLASDESTLAEAIRPSGYYNIKARRLHNLCEFLSAQGGVDALGRQPLPDQRAGLLGVNGVGPETADDILLYALDQPVFVIDTYTRRLLRRYDLARGDEPYEVLRAGFEATLPADVAMFQQFHALIVVHAKEACRKKPACERCGIFSSCARSVGD
jgi:endonuclease-3 related protein